MSKKSWHQYVGVRAAMIIAIGGIVAAAISRLGNEQPNVNIITVNYPPPLPVLQDQKALQNRRLEKTDEYDKLQEETSVFASRISQYVDVGRSEHHLKRGWNLFTPPTRPFLDLPRAVFPQECGAVVLFSYDPSDRAPWKSYNSEKPRFLNSLSALEPSLGYWVNVEEFCTLRIVGTKLKKQVALAEGFNLVGIPVSKPTAVEDVIASIETSLVRVWGLRDCHSRVSTELDWETYPRRDDSAAIERIYPACAYWIEVTEATCLAL